MCLRVGTISTLKILYLDLYTCGCEVFTASMFCTLTYIISIPVAVCVMFIPAGKFIIPAVMHLFFLRDVIFTHGHENVYTGAVVHYQNIALRLLENGHN